MKPLLRKTTKLAGAVAYSVVFAEVFVRIMDPVALMPRYVTGAEDGIRKNIPNATYWQTTPEVRVQIRTNSQGLRADRDFTLTPPGNVCRLALFGDSFFMGYEVDLEDSIAGRLEQGLTDRGYQVEVLNFAVSGFGAAENLIALEERALEFDPDIVVFEWHTSDIEDDTRSQLFELVDGNLVRDQETFLPAIETRDFLMQFAAYRWLIGNSHLYSVVREKAAEAVKGLLVRLASIGESDGSDDARPGSPEGAPVGVPAFNQNAASEDADPQKSEQPQGPSQEAQRSYAVLKRAQQSTRDSGAFFLLADVPKRHSRTRFEVSTSRLPEAVYREFVVANPMDAFEANAGPDTKLYYEEGHYHLTPLGNQLVVDSIEEKILNHADLSHCRQDN